MIKHGNVSLSPMIKHSKMEVGWETTLLIHILVPTKLTSATIMLLKCNRLVSFFQMGDYQSITLVIVINNRGGFSK